MKIVKMIYEKFLFPLVRAGRKNSDIFSMDNALKRSLERKHDFSTIIDIGASDGRWSETCMKYYPESKYFLIEAQNAHEEKLKSLKNNKKNLDYIISAAGDKDGKIFFDNSGLFGGVAAYEKKGESYIEVDMVTIDSVVERNRLHPPFLLKFDTHGFEERIFAGAEKTLQKTEMIIVEAYAHPISGTFRFFELCSFLKGKGFLPVEIVDLMLRPYDSTLWQMELFFIKDTGDKFKYDEYV